MRNLIVILFILLSAKMAYTQGTFEEKPIIDIYEPGNIMITLLLPIQISNHILFRAD